MYSFGSRNEIQIQYNFLEEGDPNKSTFEDTWGEFRIYVSDRNLCEFNVNSIIYNYQNHLFWITEWLCKNLTYIVGYDPFPVPVSGNSAIELLKNTDILKINLEIKDECEMLLVDQARFEWSSRHSWFTSRGGSILPWLFFRRIDESIEISWDNTFWMDDGINYINLIGCHLIRIGTFKNVMLDFLKDYLNRWESIASKCNKSIDILPALYRHLSIFNE